MPTHAPLSKRPMAVPGIAHSVIWAYRLSDRGGMAADRARQ